MSTEEDQRGATEQTPLLQDRALENGVEEPGSNSKDSWLNRNLIGIFSIVFILAGIVLVFIFATGLAYKRHSAKSEVCLTPACVHAASEILYNLSPDYKNLDACTDFEQLVCGGWDDRHDLRPDQGDAFTGTIMSESSQMLLRHILEAPYPNDSEHSSFSPAQLIHSLSSADQENFDKLQDAYSACMDEDAIKKIGVAPLMKILNAITEIFPAPVVPLPINITNELTDTIIYLANLGVHALVGAGTGADEKDPDTVVIYVSSQGSIGLPAKDYYTDDSILKKYEEALVQVMGALYPNLDETYELMAEWENTVVDHKQNAPWRNIRDIAHGLVGFEKQLAVATPDAADQNDVTKYYNPMSLQYADTLTPQIHLSRLIDNLAPKDYETNRIIIMTPEYMKDLGGLLENTSREVLQMYFLWKFIQRYSSFVELDAIKPYQRFKNELQGKDPESIPERWRTCVGHVDDGLGWILSRFFVEKAFSARAKDFGDRIVSDIKDKFIEKLQATKWMDKSVIELAIDKVHQIIQKIGYPTKSPDIMDPASLKDYYLTVNISSSKFFENALSMSRFEIKRDWSSLGHPVDRDEWGMTVPTVNAYYNPPGNEIVFPAGIMQFPVFDVDVPEYVSYGAFGSVSGHELSHAFDSTGRHYDQNGNYTDWWTNSTVTAFEKRARCFVDQYARYTVDGPGKEPLHVNGKLTLGENIADAGGLSAAFAAWKSSQAASHSYYPSEDNQDQDLPGLEHFTHEQLFFVSYANWWCGKSRKETAIQRIYTDPHAPKWARILGTMANSRDFRESFGCEDKKPVCELW